MFVTKVEEFSINLRQLNDWLERIKTWCDVCGTSTKNLGKR